MPRLQLTHEMELMGKLRASVISMSLAICGSSSTIKIGSIAFFPFR